MHILYPTATVYICKTKLPCKGNLHTGLFEHADLPDVPSKLQLNTRRNVQSGRLTYKEKRITLRIRDTWMVKQHQQTTVLTNSIVLYKISGSSLQEPVFSVPYDTVHLSANTATKKFNLCSWQRKHILWTKVYWQTAVTQLAEKSSPHFIKAEGSS
jgi:hypothetical protein